MHWTKGEIERINFSSKEKQQPDNWFGILGSLECAKNLRSVGESWIHIGTRF
jgi:hypothetical protein